MIYIQIYIYEKFIKFFCWMNYIRHGQGRRYCVCDGNRLGLLVGISAVGNSFDSVLRNFHLLELRNRIQIEKAREKMKENERKYEKKTYVKAFKTNGRKENWLNDDRGDFESIFRYILVIDFHFFPKTSLFPFMFSYVRNKKFKKIFFVDDFLCAFF